MMAAFLAGIGVALFLVATAGISYYFGASTKKSKVEVEPITEDEIREQELIKQHKRDFNNLMNYTAEQALKRAGE